MSSVVNTGCSASWSSPYTLAPPRLGIILEEVVAHVSTLEVGFHISILDHVLKEVGHIIQPVYVALAELCLVSLPLLDGVCLGVGVELVEVLLLCVLHLGLDDVVLSLDLVFA